MILSGHQPVYLPGVILFNKIALSDRFMFVGHVQFSHKSWQQRNRVNLGGRELFLSVPVRKADRFGQSIDEAEIQDDGWRRKHLGSIRQAYGKHPFFADYFPGIEAEITADHPTLGALNRALIRRMMVWLDIATPVDDSRDHPAIQGAKTDMLIEMCQAVGADRYLSNEGARVYVEEARMAEAGIHHCWQIFASPQYVPGARVPFLPDVSAIDLLFSLGPAAAAVVRAAGRVEPGPFAPAPRPGARA